MSKLCVLEEGTVCHNCFECDVCDLDPQKTCNNCERCIENADYSSVEIDDIIVDQ